jgi:hypothetical protein
LRDGTIVAESDGWNHGGSTMQLLEAELAPESILPAQLGDRPFGGARIQPEKRLQTAVLADAVLTFRKWARVERPRAPSVFAEVDAWFASDDAEGPFTFITICDSLGFDPAYIRRGLRQWRTRVEASAEGTASVRRDASGSRHQVVFPRLRRVA